MSLSWLQKIASLAPMILHVVAPQLDPIGSVITSSIQEAEQMSGASGTDKLNHVVNIANQAVAGINTAAGKTLVDPTNLNASLVGGINTAISVVNLLHKNTTPVGTAVQ